MSEFETKLAFMEGPQGAGKTSATEYATTLGFRPVRGIPTGEKLIKNTTSENWCQSLAILEQIANDGIPSVSDRSFWSLVVYKMRKKPEMAESFYTTGSRMFRQRIDGVDHKVVVILASAETCIARANQNSPVAITDLSESRKEIKAYENLLERLKDDGFKACSIVNEGKSKAKFEKEIELLLR